MNNFKTNDNVEQSDQIFKNGNNYNLKCKQEVIHGE
jgi:hypothetical protein